MEPTFVQTSLAFRRSKGREIFSLLIFSKHSIHLSKMEWVLAFWLLQFSVCYITQYTVNRSPTCIMNQDHLRYIFPFEGTCMYLTWCNPFVIARLQSGCKGTGPVSWSSCLVLLTWPLSFVKKVLFHLKKNLK